MSNQNEPNQPRKKSEILEAEIAEIWAALKKLAPTPSTTSTKDHDHEPPVQQKGHKDLEEVANCPTCKAKLIEKYRPEILAEARTKIKSMKQPKLCEDCGEILDGEENRDCPNCHGTNF